MRSTCLQTQGGDNKRCRHINGRLLLGKLCVQGKSGIPNKVPLGLSNYYAAEAVCDAKVKSLPDGERRVTLRMSDVPLDLMTKLQLVVPRIDGSLRLLASRVIHTSRFYMVVDLDVVDPAVSGDLWRLEGLGCTPLSSRGFIAEGQSIPQFVLALHRQHPFRDSFVVIGTGELRFCLAWFLGHCRWYFVCRLVCTEFPGHRAGC